MTLNINITEFSFNLYLSNGLSFLDAGHQGDPDRGVALQRHHAGLKPADV